MKLRVKQDYRSNAAQYRAGEIVEVSAEFGAWLQRDSAESFEEITPKRSYRKPPRDKAITEATEK